MTMTRKEFMTSVAGLAGLATVVGCGGTDKSVDAAPGMCTMPNAGISMNHGHSVTIPIADVDAGLEKTYTFVGGTHTHMITISAAQFATIKSMTSVMVTSTLGGTTPHMHTVTVTCTS